MYSNFHILPAWSIFYGWNMKRRTIQNAVRSVSYFANPLFPYTPSFFHSKLNEASKIFTTKLNYEAKAM